jgi:hypothetical protein
MMLLALALVRCDQFPTRYDRIETNTVRSIGFMYTPQAEGAPGDTLHVRAFFCGEPTDSVSWQLSYDDILSNSSATIINIRPLTILSTTKRLPDSEDISFIIPDSAFFLTKAIAPATLNMIRSSLPAGMQSMSQAGFASFLSDIGSVDLNDAIALNGLIGKWGGVLGISGINASSLNIISQTIGALMEVFSIHGELFAVATSAQGASLKIKSEFTIRYNSRFNNTPLAGMFPVNRNPALRWIGVYKTKKTTGKSRNFGENPTLTPDDTLTWLYNEYMPWKVNDTILIDKNYDYYLATDSGTVAFAMKAGDSLLDNGRVLKFSADTTFVGDTMLDKRFIRFDSTTGKPVYDYEYYTYDWEYQNLALDSVTLPEDSLFVLTGGSASGPAITGFLPSQDKKMTHTRIWVTASDHLLGELNRPVGQTIRTVDLYFKYTP